MANPETLLGEIEAKTRELIGTVIYCVHTELFFSEALYVLNVVVVPFFCFSQAHNTPVGVHQK